MTAAERLDQIEARWAAWHDDEPYSERQWEELDDAYTAARTVHTDVAMAWEITREDVPALVAALRAVLDRHEPETRWQSDPDSEWSYDTPEDAAAYEEMDPAECTSFVICRECGRVEKADAERQDHGEFSGYAESLYPCPTVRAIEEALS